VVVEGTATNFVSRTVVGSGGTIAGGTSSVMRIANPTTTGGAICGGVATHNFFDYEYGSGGMRTGTYRSNSKVEKIKYREPSDPDTGIGRCIEGCILAIVPTEESKLFKPKYFVEQTSLKTNPRQQLTGVWCQVEDACEEGVLPRVIQKRLKGFIPDPKGTISPRDRGIATATGI
jgi:hypothetical protein